MANPTDTPHIERLEDALKYRRYKQHLEDNGLTVKAIRPLEIIRKGNGEVLFAFCDIDVETPDQRHLPHTVMLRGHFVSVLTCLIDAATGERFLLLVRQRRVANGDFFYEHPAGMVDNTTDAVAVAEKEVEEETGLSLNRADIRPLHDKLLYTSPGLLDEAGYVFYAELTLPRSEIDALDDNRFVSATETEDISTAVVPFAEAYDLMIHTNGLLMLHLYERLTTGG